MGFLSYMIFCNHCKYCGELIGYGEELCIECKNDLPRITAEKCNLCGAGKDRCACKKAKMKYDGISSPFYYEKGIERAICGYKFADRIYMADVFAEDMVHSLKRDFDGVKFDFIDYIPFSRKQKLKRRYNPSQELAKCLSKRLGIPVENVLIKLFETDSQHGVKGEYRHGNVAGAYGVKSSADIVGKTVLLVDDIKTTGSTLNECIRVLKIAGADKVYCTVAAIRPAKEKEQNNENKSKKSNEENSSEK